jgi:hypothetical protein
MHLKTHMTTLGFERRNQSINGERARDYLINGERERERDYMCGPHHKGVTTWPRQDQHTKPGKLVSSADQF